MTRYSARLRELEKRLAPPERPEYRVVLWVHDDDPPDWATEAFRPYIPTDRGVQIVVWTRCPETDGLAAEIAGQRYEVTPDGCEPTEPSITFSLGLDNPNDAGPPLPGGDRNEVG